MNLRLTCSRFVACPGPAFYDDALPKLRPASWACAGMKALLNRRCKRTWSSICKSAQLRRNSLLSHAHQRYGTHSHSKAFAAPGPGAHLNMGIQVRTVFRAGAGDCRSVCWRGSLSGRFPLGARALAGLGGAAKQARGRWLITKAAAPPMGVAAVGAVPAATCPPARCGAVVGWG